MNWKAAGMASTALAVAMVTSASAGANKFTGNVSLGLGETFQDKTLAGLSDVYDGTFTSIDANAKVNIAFESNLNLELDLSGVGSFLDDKQGNSLDRDAGFQGAAHGYWRDGNNAFGIFAGVGVAGAGDIRTNAEYYFVGLEAQHYWNNFRFGLNGGYLDSSPAANGAPNDLFLSSAWFVDANARWYATPKFTLSADVGYISGNRDSVGSGVDQKTWHWGAKAEYWPEEKEPLSLWVAYEGRSTDFDTNVGSDDHTAHTVKVGLTFHFGVDGGAQDQDRQGPAFDQMDYGQIVVGG